MRLKLKSNLYSRRTGGILMLLACFLSYTIGDALNKALSGRYPLYELVALLGIAALWMAVKAFLSATPGLLRTKRPGLLIFRGLVMFVHYIACYYSFAHLPLVNVYSFMFFSPVLVTLLSSLLLKERVGIPIWIAVVVGFAGILIMLRPGLVPMQPAFYVAMATALTSAAATLLMRYASKTETNESVLFYSGMVISICALFMSYGHFVMPTPTDAVLMLGMASFMALGWFLMMEGFRRTTTPVGAPFQYTQLIWAAIVGWIVWHTLPDFWSFVGMAVVAGSGMLTFWHEARLQQTVGPDDAS